MGIQAGMVYSLSGHLGTGPILWRRVLWLYLYTDCFNEKTDFASTLLLLFKYSAVRRSENFKNKYFFAIQSGITVYILFHKENVIWNQI